MQHTRRLCVHGDKCHPTSFKALLNCRVLHHPMLSLQDIVEACGVKSSRLKKYIAESEPDQIPFLTLLRIAAFLDAWDLVDFALQKHGRRTSPLDVSEAQANPLNEAVDVTLASAALLQEVRSAAPGGFDDREKVRILEHVRVVHRQADEVAAALDQGGPK